MRGPQRQNPTRFAVTKTLHLQREAVVSFSQAAKRFAARPSISTLHRWAAKGVGGVVLESFWIGCPQQKLGRRC